MTRGGKRTPGPGKKIGRPAGSDKQMISIRLPQDILEWLDGQENKTTVIVKVLRTHIRRCQMKLYIYNVETMEVIATATGESNKECEDKAFAYLGTDEYAGTYTPAFGTTEGLVDTGKAENL